MLVVGLGLRMEAELPALIPLRVGQKFGYCDASMKLVIPTRYQDATPFVRERAIVMQGDLYGMIDPTGKWLLYPEYDEITLGKLVFVRQGKRHALADYEGCLLTDFSFDRVHALKDGLVLLDQGGRKGLADAAGKLLVPCIYDYVSTLRDDQGNTTELYLVQRDGLMGLYNACGDMLQPPRFSRVDVFQEGHAVVQEQGRFGLIDVEGEVRVPCEYDLLQGMSEGLVAAKLKNRWGFIDGLGRQALPFHFEAVHEGGFFQGRAAVSKAGTWMFVQRDGEVEFPLDEGYQSLGCLSEGLIPICKMVDEGTMRFGYVDPQGRLRIHLRYERAEAFDRGFAIVGLRIANLNSVIKEMRYGVIDRSGRLVVPVCLGSQTEARLKRDSLGRVGFTTVIYRGRACKVDARGRRFDCKVDAMDHIQRDWVSTRCEQSAWVAVARDGLWGFCDERGKRVIPCQYAAVDCFSGGLARVWPVQDPKTPYYIDEQGRPYVLPSSS